MNSILVQKGIEKKALPFQSRVSISHLVFCSCQNLQTQTESCRQIAWRHDLILHTVVFLWYLNKKKQKTVSRKPQGKSFNVNFHQKKTNVQLRGSHVDDLRSNI